MMAWEARSIKRSGIISSSAVFNVSDHESIVGNGGSIDRLRSRIKNTNHPEKIITNILTCFFQYFHCILKTWLVLYCPYDFVSFLENNIVSESSSSIIKILINITIWKHIIVLSSGILSSISFHPAYPLLPTHPPNLQAPKCLIWDKMYWLHILRRAQRWLRHAVPHTTQQN